MEQTETWLLVGAAAIVFWNIVSGWKQGVVRQALRFISLGAAYVAAFLAGGMLVPVLRPLGFPDLVLRGLGGALIAIFVYFSLNGVGALLFKKTSQQENGLVRFFYGAGGAAVGALYGLVFVWMIAIGIRLLGSVADATAHSPAPARQEQPQWDPVPDTATSLPGEPEPEPALARPTPVAPPPPPPPSRIVGALSVMKRALDSGAAGPVIEKVDPIPPKAYAILEKVGALAGNRSAAERFLEYPGARELIADPKILALRDDPEISREIRRGNLVGLLRNPSVVAAANDPELGKKLRAFDLEKALDFALQPLPPPRG
jgi:uncharacterized membrane protein required for colicin V production